MAHTPVPYSPNSQSKRWFVTLNHEDVEVRRKQANALVLWKPRNRFAGVEEVAPTTGREHRHVFVEYEARHKAKDIHALLTKMGGSFDLQVAKGTNKQIMEYFGKSGNEITSKDMDSSSWVEPEKAEYEWPIQVIKPEITAEQLYDWQIDAIDNFLVPDERTIYWYYDKPGNSGKSTIARMLQRKTGCLTLTDGKKSDLLYIVEEWLHPSKKDRAPGHGLGYIFDFSRSTKVGSETYAVMEMLKNRSFTSTKYKGNSSVLDPLCSIMCLANVMPTTAMMSEDRWKIAEINIDHTLTWRSGVSDELQEDDLLSEYPGALDVPSVPSDVVGAERRRKLMLRLYQSQVQRDTQSVVRSLSEVILSDKQQLEPTTSSTQLETTESFLSTQDSLSSLSDF
uniref:CRESS-DNA virus Rep endonuclease domain-containing protein n=1 Tax=uncultured prokaryote TaxID=198431 RepID=A0A0H5Q554_9ZZZZ|nr:hypothetical protein [uncultured prokaryote]